MTSSMPVAQWYVGIEGAGPMDGHENNTNEMSWTKK